MRNPSLSPRGMKKSIRTRKTDVRERRVEGEEIREQEGQIGISLAPLVTTLSLESVPLNGRRENHEGHRGLIVNERKKKETMNLKRTNRGKKESSAENFHVT